MSLEAKQLAHDAWNATKDDVDPPYESLALSNDFRGNLDDAAESALRGRGRSGIAGLEKFEDEVARRIREQAKATAASASPAAQAAEIPADKPKPRKVRVKKAA